MSEATLSVPRKAASSTPRDKRSPLRFLWMVPIQIWLLALVIAPALFLIIYSFWISTSAGVEQTWTLENYKDVVGSATFRVLIVKTLYTALGSAALATLIAYPMAYFASRKLSRYRLLAVMLVIIPLWVSLLMRVFGWKIILGENGVINSSLIQLGIIDQPLSILLYTRASVILTMTYVAIPFVFISAYTALERIPNSLYEASSDSGARPWQTFRQIVWPLSKQGVALGFALASLIALGDYLTPALVGGLGGTMVGSVIASQFGLAGNWSLGAAMAITLMLSVGVIFLLLARLARSEGQLDTPGESRAVDTGERGVRWYLARALFVLPYIYLYAPLIAISVFSFNDSTVQALPFEGFTLQWYDEMFGNSEILKALKRSLTVSGGAILIAAVVGTGFALIFNSIRIKGAPVMQSLMSIPVLLPGVVLGISLAILFREIGFDPGLRNVLIGHAAFVTPVVMFIVASRLRRLDPSYVQASMDLGANRLQTFWHVTLPEIRVTLLGACLLGFTLSFDEIIVTYFLTGNEPTLPVYVWNQLRFGFTPSINAIFVCIAVFSLILLAVCAWIMRREGLSALDATATPAPAAKSETNKP